MKGREKVEVCRQSEDIAAVLRECKIFSGMSEQTARTLLSIPPMTFAAGERIAGGETFSPCLGVILSGKASIYGRNSGRKVLLNRLSRGDVFGAASVFFEEHESVSTVVAGTKCRVLFIERDCLETIIKSDFSVASAYIEFLSGKIYFLNKKIIAFTAGSAEAALSCYLLERADMSDTVAVNMTRLASALNIGRTTLYRAADALVREGLIACDGKEIRILNRNNLEKRYKQ